MTYKDITIEDVELWLKYNRSPSFNIKENILWQIVTEVTTLDELRGWIIEGVGGCKNGQENKSNA